jgi:hypothetical protein
MHEALGEPMFTVGDGTLVVAQEFRLIERLKPGTPVRHSHSDDPDQAHSHAAMRYVGIIESPAGRGLL